MEYATAFLVIVAGVGLTVGVVCCAAGDLLAWAQQFSPRKQVLGWGLAVFLAMSLFPPFQDGHDVRYGCILADPPGGCSGALASGRLLFQWLVLGVSLFGVSQLAGDRPGNPTPAAVPPAAPAEKKNA